MDPILTKYVREPNSYTLDFFVKHQGYEGLKKALGMKPAEVIDRPVVIYVAGTVGGGIDLYARLVGRHLGRHDRPRLVSNHTKQLGGGAGDRYSSGSAS